MTTTSVIRVPHGDRFAVSINSDVQVTAFLNQDEFLRMLEQMIKVFEELKKEGRV